MSRLDLTQEISQELMGLLPEFIREDAPLFEQFLKAYFEFLDTEIITIDTQSDIDYVALEDEVGAVLYETSTTSPSPDADNSRIINETSPGNVNQTASPLLLGEYIYGETTGTLAEILVINSNILHVKTITGRGFLNGEKVFGRTSGQTFNVKSYKENTIRANNNLLNYSDVDLTTSNLIEYWQRDFIPSLNFGDIQSNRIALKNIGDFYKQKGSPESVKYLIRLLYGNDSEIFYPNDTTLYTSESDYSQSKRMTIEMVNTARVPKPTDKITQYGENRIIQAQSLIEQVSFLGNGIYSIDVTQVLSDPFTVDALVEIQDRDGRTNFEARVRGNIVGVKVGESSTYICDEENVGDVLLFEDGSGILTEEFSIGSNYRINDRINFLGSKDDTDVLPSSASVSGLTSGSIDEILISDPGSGFYSTTYLPIEIPVENSYTIAVNDPLDIGIQPGLRILGANYHSALRITSVASNRLSFTVDKKITLPVGSSLQIETPQYVVFDDRNTKGTGAEGIIGSVFDQFILENAPDVFGQYQFTVSGSLTTISGKDDFGKRLMFNDNTVEVYVDEVIRLENDSTYGYTKKNDRIIFNNPLTPGQVVDIYHVYNYLTYEDNSYIGLENEFNILTGTIDFVNSSDQITGTSTLFQSELRQGDTLIDSNNLKYKVSEVLNDTLATLQSDATITQSETGVKRIRESGAIRSVILPDTGYSYETVPRVYPGGYFYFTDIDDLDVFQVDEVITGLTSNAQVTVLRIEKDKKRLIVRRESNQSGYFEYGEAVQGNVGLNPKIPSGFNIASGTGAQLYVYGSNIGGVAEINITNQGGYFNSDGNADGSSTYNMVIKTPSSSLNRDTEITGRISGATGKVISYDADRHILYYKDLEGTFLYNEYVDYGLTDTFQVLKVDTFNSRGEFGTTAIVERNLIGDRGAVSSTAANIQDSLYYQTHSYVVRTAESINTYRSVLKDLVHPAGHIFFGEVSVQNFITDTKINTFFLPTIIIHGDPVLAVPNAFQYSIRIFEIHTKSNGLITEDGMPIILESGGQISVTLDDQMNFINDPLLKLRDANEPKGDDPKRTGPEEDPTTGGALQPYQIVDGTEIGAGTEYYDSGMRNQHINLRIISTFASAAQRTRLANRYTNVDPNTLEYVSQKPYVSLTGDVQDGDFPVLTQTGVYGFDQRTAGGLTVLNLDYPNPVTEGEPTNSYPRNSSGSGKNRFGGVDGYFISEPRKLAEQGKILSYQNLNEEKLILEDGGLIEREVRPERMRTEPRSLAEVKGDFGDYIIFENDEYLELEVGTIVREEILHFVTERSYQQTGHNLYTEDDYTIVTEDNFYIINEQSSENSITSFVPLGTSLRSLNRIAGQRIFDITYYIQNEDEDNIVLEDNTGTLMSEVSISEGLRINHLSSYYEGLYVSEFPEHGRKRTNLAYSTYVTSA